jgi:hypothetical protein
MRKIPVSPLSLNQLTREYWGLYDSRVISQLAPLVNSKCYQPKFYKAPGDDAVLLGPTTGQIAPYGYVNYGLQITPGSLIFGFYLPMRSLRATPNVWVPYLLSPGPFTVQITDVSLQHTWWDDPVSSVFLANFKPTFQAEDSNNMGSFPNLLTTPYPVVGSGLFDVAIQNTDSTVDAGGIAQGVAQRIQLVFGVLEVCNAE